MEIQFDSINWLAILACVIIGQIFLTLWFVVFFGEPWAKCYDPNMTRGQHTKDVPGYTYAIGALCTFLLTLTIAMLQASLGINSLGGGLQLAIFISIGLSISTALPGYAFLRRWKAFYLAAGSQFVLIFIISSVLAIWQK